jgi:hypothetical protein
MPGSMLVEFVGEMVFKPIFEWIVERTWHLTGRAILRRVARIGDQQLVITPDEPELKTREQMSQKERPRPISTIPSQPLHLRPLRVRYSAVSLLGLVVWLVFAGSTAALIWLL